MHHEAGVEALRGTQYQEVLMAPNCLRNLHLVPTFRVSRDPNVEIFGTHDPYGLVYIDFCQGISAKAHFPPIKFLVLIE